MQENELLRAAFNQAMRGDPFSRYGAHSISVGRKTVAGKKTDQRAIVFYVACKLPLSEISPARRIPAELRFIDLSAGVERILPTDVIESPAPTLLALPPGARHRPVPGGVRCYLPSINAGTLGGWVWDRTDESIVFLSNQHVLGDVAGAEVYQPNSDAFAPPGETNLIGRVKRAAGLTAGTRPFTEDQCHFADAAVGSINDTGDIGLTVLEIGPAIYETDTVVEDMIVEKSGQITGHTVGRVTNELVNTVTDFPGVGEVVMCDLFRVEPLEADEAFSGQGDSGSLIFRQDPAQNINPAVGLLYAGGGSATSGNNYALGCKIHNVFAALDIDVLCSGGFAAFLDALFAEAGEDVVAARAVSIFSPRRPPGAATRFADGLAREVQARLKSTPGGRLVADFVQENRADIMQLLVRSGDVRRAAVQALRPILRGAATVDRLFDRTLGQDDIDRLQLLVETAETQGPPGLRKAMAPLRTLLGRARGKTIAEIVRAGPKRRGTSGGGRSGAPA